MSFAFTSTNVVGNTNNGGLFEPDTSGSTLYGYAVNRMTFVQSLKLDDNERSFSTEVIQANQILAEEFGFDKHSAGFRRLQAIILHLERILAGRFSVISTYPKFCIAGGSVLSAIKGNELNRDIRSAMKGNELNRDIDLFFFHAHHARQFILNLVKLDGVHLDAVTPMSTKLHVDRDDMNYHIDIITSCTNIKKTLSYFDLSICAFGLQFTYKGSEIRGSLFATKNALIALRNNSLFVNNLSINPTGIENTNARIDKYKIRYELKVPEEVRFIIKQAKYFARDIYHGNMNWPKAGGGVQLSGLYYPPVDAFKVLKTKYTGSSGKYAFQYDGRPFAYLKAVEMEEELKADYFDRLN